jgi:hypothetical protein
MFGKLKKGKKDKDKGGVKNVGESVEKAVVVVNTNPVQVAGSSNGNKINSVSVSSFFLSDLFEKNETNCGKIEFGNKLKQKRQTAVWVGQSAVFGCNYMNFLKKFEEISPIFTFNKK